MDFNDLTQEERELVIGKTPEEILALAKERGRELSNEELEAISGGNLAIERWGTSVECQKCKTIWIVDSSKPAWQTCPNCGNRFYA